MVHGLHPLFSAPDTHTHTHLFFYLFPSTVWIPWHHPSLPVMIYSIVSLPHNSIQDNCFLSTVCQALSLVIRSQNHLGAESSWTLPSHAQYPTQTFDHKIPLFLPLKYHPNIIWSTSLLSSHDSGPRHFSPRKIKQPDVSPSLQYQSISTLGQPKIWPWTNNAKIVNGSIFSIENSPNFSSSIRGLSSSGQSPPLQSQVSQTPAFSLPLIIPPRTIIGSYSLLYS